jgi:hypothetical protein
MGYRSDRARSKSLQPLPDSSCHKLPKYIRWQRLGFRLVELINEFNKQLASIFQTKSSLTIMSFNEPSHPYRGRWTKGVQFMCTAHDNTNRTNWVSFFYFHKEWNRRRSGQPILSLGSGQFLHPISGKCQISKLSRLGNLSCNLCSMVSMLQAPKRSGSV